MHTILASWFHFPIPFYFLFQAKSCFINTRAIVILISCDGCQQAAKSFSPPFFLLSLYLLLTLLLILFFWQTAGSSSFPNFTFSSSLPFSSAERPREGRGTSCGAVHGPGESHQAHRPDRLHQVCPHPHVWNSDEGQSHSEEIHFLFGLHQRQQKHLEYSLNAVKIQRVVGKYSR